MSQNITISYSKPYIITFCVLFSICFKQVYAQSLPKPTYITTEDGLSNRFVTSIRMDSRNLLWIGTELGLERFDGIEFLKMNNQKNSDIFFPGRNVATSGISVINDFTLLVVADEKLYTVDLCAFTWQEIKLPYNIKGKVSHLFKSAKNEIFLNIIHEDSILLINYNDGRFDILDATPKAKINITSIAVDTKENIWWSTPLEGIKVWNKNIKLRKVIKPDSINWYDTKIFTVPIFIDSKDRIFFFPKSVHELWQYNPVENSVRIIAKGMESPFYNGLEDKQGNLWFYCRRQLIRLKPHLGEYRIQDITDHIGKNLNYTLIRQLYEDNSNILWIATNNGLIKQPIGPQLIDRYLEISDMEWGNEMRGIFESRDGTIYAYCENYTQGLHSINAENQTSHLITDLRLKNKNAGNYLFGKYFCYHKKLNKAYYVIDDLLSVDLTHHSINTEWPCNDVTEKLDRNPIELLSDSILILGATPSKTTLYDPLNKKKLIRFTNLPDDINIKNSCFGEDKSGNIWIGTNQGIYITNRKGELLHHIHTGSSPALSNNMILTIKQDKNKNIWVGTLGGGVNLIKFKEKNDVGDHKSDAYLAGISIESISREQGLCNENIPGILEDDYGYMWFSTYDGLARYHPASKSFLTFITSDGISNNEFNYASAFKDSKGNLWFGGLNGITKINPGRINTNNQTAPLELTGITKYNRISKIQEKKFIAENLQPYVYEIFPDDSWFQFNWTLPNYLNNKKNSYYVRLSGLNDTWQYNGNLAFIRYHNLAPGNYTLYIKGADSKGNWSPEVLKINIKVHTVFYMTWWFNILLIVLCGCIVYGIYKYNLDKKLEMEQMRVKIASDLHDEVGSMLSGLAMQSELLMLDKRAPSQSKLENIAFISRNVIGKMRDLVWSIDGRRDSMQDLIDKMKEQVSELFTQKDIDYSFDVVNLPMSLILSVNVRQQLFFIFTEAITNIIRHSDADFVIIKLENNKESFIMAIKDNGTTAGINKKITGLGISNMSMRAVKIGARLRIENEGGFEVKITMKKL